MLTISEAATLLEVSTKTLREWDRKGILNPKKTEGGHRRYAIEDVRLMRHCTQDVSLYDKFLAWDTKFHKLNGRGPKPIELVEFWDKVLADEEVTDENEVQALSVLLSNYVQQNGLESDWDVDVAIKLIIHTYKNTFMRNFVGIQPTQSPVALTFYMHEIEGEYPDTLDLKIDSSPTEINRRIYECPNLLAFPLDENIEIYAKYLASECDQSVLTAMDDALAAFGSKSYATREEFRAAQYDYLFIPDMQAFETLSYLYDRPDEVEVKDITWGIKQYPNVGNTEIYVQSHLGGDQFAGRKPNTNMGASVIWHPYYLVFNQPVAKPHTSNFLRREGFFFNTDLDRLDKVTLNTAPTL